MMAIMILCCIPAVLYQGIGMAAKRHDAGGGGWTEGHGNGWDIWEKRNVEIRIEVEENPKLIMMQGEKCDKYDYLIAVFSGMAAGFIDIFLVNAPQMSKLGTLTDSAADELVKTCARMAGWKPRAGKEDSVASAIGFFERNFKVNYDQSTTAGVNGAFPMNTRNHHFKSLGHSPDPIGLFFSILDQFTGKASFLSDGRLIRVDTSGSNFELRGTTFGSKLFCGFCNWLGHIMSDMAGSSGNRGAEGSGRGMGVPIPFMELFQLCNFGSFQIGDDRQTLAVLMTRVFEEGYDARFGAAMAVPVLVEELMVRILWTVKKRFFDGADWSQCFPDTKRHSDLRIMLLVGNGCLCLMDGADAAIRAKGNMLVFMLHLNMIAWFKLVLAVLKEIGIQFGFTYYDLKLHIEKINEALDSYIEVLKSVDYDGYERELEEIGRLNLLLESGSMDAAPLYAYLERTGADMQFYSFEEFEERMQDDTFVLEI